MSAPDDDGGGLPVAILAGGFSDQALLAAGAVRVFEQLDDLRAELDRTPFRSV